jgi:hypothetical protein
MFYPNNANIDFAELSRRIALEVGRQAPRRPFPVVPKLAQDLGEPRHPQKTMPAARPAATPDTINKATSGRLLWRRVLILVWCIRHFRVILRRAIAGVHAAERAEGGVGELQRQMQQIRTRLDWLEDQAWPLAEAPRHHRVEMALSAKAEAITYAADLESGDRP